MSRGCSRRDFLTGAAGAAGAAALLQLPLFVRPGAAGQAAAPGGSPLLVVVFLRGGCDGLALVPPVGDTALTQARGALVPAKPLPLGGEALEFALHPALTPLAFLASQGNLAAVHAVGLPHPVRSHSEAQDLCERAGARAHASTPGWLARALAASPNGPSAFRAVAAVLRRPLSLAGDPRALAFERTGDLESPARSPSARRALARLFATQDSAGSHAAWARAGREALEAVAALEAHRDDRLPRGLAFPRGELGERLATVARLARADLGLTAAWVDTDGYDTHIAQGDAEGRLARVVQRLGEGLAALWRALEHRADDVLVLVATEFGRTVAANGSGGTDHGRGGAALALGGRVRGGRAVADWPGLRREELADGRDLRVTTDIRDVFAAGARHLGARDLAAVFPGHAPRNLGLHRGDPGI